MKEVIRVNKHGILKTNDVIHKYGNYILLCVLLVNVILMIVKKYVYIECFTISMISIILLLRNKIHIIDFYIKPVIMSILVIVIALGLGCSLLYDTHNFLYLVKGYVECVVLESNEYSLLSVSAAADNDGRYSINKSTQMIYRNNARDFYERYMMKNNQSLDEDFMIIEKIVGQIKEYRPFSDNVYYLELQEGGGIFVVMNKYSKFTIFKFIVNS